MADIGLDDISVAAALLHDAVEDTSVTAEQAFGGTFHVNETFNQLESAYTAAYRDELPDPGNVHIETRLNGRVMQSASTDDLVFGVAELIEYYSRFYLFRPGDVITTGSPSGVGYGRNPKVFMKPGDVIEVEVREIGILRNPVEA